MDYRKFKETEDIQEAKDMLPAILKKIKEKSKRTDGTIDKEKLRSELRSLKLNNYQTMPNPQTQPSKFREYMQFIKDTQGQEAADALREDYIRRNRINRGKSSMVH